MTHTTAHAAVMSDTSSTVMMMDLDGTTIAAHATSVTATVSLFARAAEAHVVVCGGVLSDLGLRFGDGLVLRTDESS